MKNPKREHTASMCEIVKLAEKLEILELPPEYRETLHAYLEGKPAREIADQLGIGDSTLHGRIAKISFLGECLGRRAHSIQMGRASTPQ